VAFYESVWVSQANPIDRTRRDGWFLYRLYTKETAYFRTRWRCLC